jgi:transposase-like protein
MINKEFNTIIELLQAFPNEQTCIDHLTALRWEDGNVISPFDAESKVYKCADNRYRCKKTGKYFNVKTATLFGNTKVELQKWFLAIWLVKSHKKGISSIQLSKDIGITQKTAWLMLHRIRNCFRFDSDNNPCSDVEVDEAYICGKTKVEHTAKRDKGHQVRSVKDTPSCRRVSVCWQDETKHFDDATVYPDEWLRDNALNVPMTIDS